MAKKSKKSALSVSSIFPFAFLSFITTVGAFVITLNLTTFMDHQKVLGIQTTQAKEDLPAQTEDPRFDEEKAYWQDIITKYPSYRDGYIELAQIVFDEGDKTRALNLVSQAKLVDPNSPVVAEFLQKLQ